MGDTLIKLPMNIRAVVNSLRSLGYTFEDAVADIIDNSISAGAKHIDIRYSTADKNNLFVAFCDDGCGMTESEVGKALCFGEHVKNRDMPNQLGKFGMGLKTASLSQCRSVVVASKKGGMVSAFCIDLSLLEQTGEMLGRRLSELEIQNDKVLMRLPSQKQGTVVMWRDFDRLSAGMKKEQDVGKLLMRKLCAAKEHVALVFHEFYGDVEIKFNGGRVPARDPFLIQAYPRRQEGAPVVLGDGAVAHPYALPYEKLLRDEERSLLGGDKDDYFKNQGLYIYRNKRLISYGGWFRLEVKSENYQYARVRIDLEAGCDSLWMLDVRKATVQLPESIKMQLRTAIADALGKSRRICDVEWQKRVKSSVSNLWKFKQVEGGTPQVKVNLDEDICRKVLECATDDGVAFRDFVRCLEENFPWTAIAQMQ